MERIRLSDTDMDTAAAWAAATLRAGGIVLYPTDTVYGLGADAGNEEALASLARLKGRPDGKPFLLAVAYMDMAARYGYFTPLAQELANEYWPGALTLVLDAERPLSPFVSKDGSIALRAPAHPFCAALSRAFGAAYTSTSANPAGKEPGLDPDAIIATLGSAVDIALVIDGGMLMSSQGSTIVDARGGEPHILRQGSLSIVN